MGVIPKIDFTVLVKTKIPKIQQLETKRAKEDLGRLGDLVENVERAVKNEVYYPVETPMNCSTCSYRTECKEWKPDRNRITPTATLYELNGVGSC